MATLTMEAVRKSYGGREVVHGFTCAVADGELVVVVGPSGCGKSTLLRMVAGLEPVTSGTLSIDGRVVNAVEPKDRDIAMVFQNYALYPHMSVYANMAYGLKMRRMGRAEIRERVERAAGILQLQDLLCRKPRQLSGGQRQRVAMGRAIVRDPKIFLFDEPLSNLDAKLRVQMRVEIKQLQQELGTTSLYVTHDQVEAMTLGAADQIGPPLALYERPATAFVAGFIGSPAMNLLDGRIAEGGVAIDGALLPADGPREPGRSVIVGLRPEHIEFAPGGPMSVKIELLERLGADTILHGRLGERGPTVAARVPGTMDPGPGSILSFAIRPERIHLFDPDSGRRIESLVGAA